MKETLDDRPTDFPMPEPGNQATAFKAEIAGSLRTALALHQLLRQLAKGAT